MPMWQTAALACISGVQENTVKNDQLSSSASDTGNVLDGTVLGALLGGQGSAEGFSINYERVPQAIADLEHAAESSSETGPGRP